MSIIGYNAKSTHLFINNLSGLEFGKSLIKIREFYSNSKEYSNIFNKIIDKYDLSKKDIRKILEETEEYNDDFIGKIERSIKNNKNKDNTNALARKLSKHCNRESTENPKKHEKIRIEHIHNLLSDNNIEELCKNMPRIVIFLDNVPAHGTDLVKDIAKTLNIYFVYLPSYSPEFAPIEGVFKIIKYELRSNILKTKEEVMNKCVEVYYEKCVNSSLWLWFVERYLTIIS